MNLENLNNNYTDKNTRHSYLPLYQKLLSHLQDKAERVLEIGIGDFGPKNGGSIKIWRDYFKNAIIYGLDILPLDRVLDELINDDRIVLYTSVDAYNGEFVGKEFIDKGLRFDFLLDDGPHTLESMKKFIQLYLPLMKENGLLIIEDVQSIDWIDELKNVTPDDFKQYVEIYDLRSIKGRYDDIVFVINKSKQLN